jgi:predicted phosphate transport protein (TIGR00153 family)
MLSRLRLIPREERFFELFDRAAGNVLEGARLLVDLLETGEDIDHKARHLKAIEHTGDELTHAIFEALNRTFVTPLDRDDISRLAVALDDVLDWVEEAGRRVRLYRMSEVPPVARQFGRIILAQAEQIVQAVSLLERWKDAAALNQAAQEIHRLENQGDELLAEALASLYEGVSEVPQLIQAKQRGDLYELLEGATDKAEHVAVALQSITVKRHG